MASEDKHANGIKNSIDNLLGTKSTLKRRKRTEEDIAKQNFEIFINNMEQLQARETILSTDLDVDFSKYNQKYYDVIDSLIELHYGPRIADIITFYLYERINEQGEILGLMDENQNVTILKNPTDLWDVVRYIQNNK